MLKTERSKVLIANGWALYAEAIELIDLGHIRSAAGKAWLSTNRATEALILERTGREPQRDSETSTGMAYLGQESEALAPLRSRYASRAWELEGDCFIDGHCEPEDYFADLVRATADYIRVVERLA